MKMYVAGFDWKVPPAVGPVAFCNAFLKWHSRQFKFRQHQRLIACAKHEGFIVGAVLSKKTNKKFTTLELDNLKVHVTSFKKNRPGVDFNLFVINTLPSQGLLHGLYLYYHHTLRPKGFNQFMAARYDALRARRIDRGTERAKGDAREVGRVKKRYKDRLAVAIKIKAGDLDTWIDSLSRVSSLEYTVTSAMPNTSAFHDAGDAIKYQQTKVKFRANAIPADLKARVKGWLRTLKPKQGRVTGMDPTRGEVSYPLTNAPGVYDVLDYDTKVSAGFLNVDRVIECDLVQYMVELMKKNTAEFGDSPC
ncbi:hypothetical protein [Gemmata sp.]|uniref:hypothetical protein n=1 Tax=Gemmata sp. TaxID=1914242 RepID=UPI003F715F6F